MVLVTNAGVDEVLVLEAAALEITVLEAAVLEIMVLEKLLTTLTLIGTRVVEITVEDAGQLVTSAEHDVTVVTSVLWMVMVNGPLGLVSLVALYPVVPAGNGVVPDERSAALCKRHSRVF
jgi:hypothetical protein